MASSGSGQTNGSQEPQTAARFALVVDGTEIGSFSELVSITNEVEVVEFVETGADGRVTRTTQPKPKPSTLVLKRGQSADRSLWMWHDEARRGSAAARRNAALVMYGPEGRALARYTLVQTWPSKLELGSVKAGDNWALYETVTLVADELRRGAP